MLRIAICEGCPSHSEIVLKLLDVYQAGRPYLKIQRQRFLSGEKLLDAIKSGDSFDALLLDTIMQGRGGIEIAREIRAKGDESSIIFLASSPDYAIDAFGVFADQYILKPIRSDVLFLALDKIAAKPKAIDDRFFLLSAPDRLVKIPFDSIVCIELAGRALCVYHKNGKTMLSKNIRRPFKENVKRLLEDSQFLHPHKSFVLNMSWVEKIADAGFIMKHGIHVPIPRHKYSVIKEQYFNWLSDSGADAARGK